MKPSILIALGLIGIFVGLGFVFPAIAHWRQSGTMASGSVMLLLLGIGLTSGGLLSGAAGVRRLKN